MYPLSTRVRNQPPHSLLDRMSRISMTTVRLQRLCLHTLSSLSKIGGAHSHVLLAEGDGLCVCGRPGVPDLTRSAFELRGSKIKNFEHRSPRLLSRSRLYLRRVNYHKLPSIFLPRRYIIVPDLQAHLVSSYIILPSSFVQHRPSTTKLIQQSPPSPRIQDELRPNEPGDRGVHARARRAERLLHTMHTAARLHAGRPLVHRINYCVFREYVRLFGRCV